jgi:hypothetical protein
MTEFELSCDEKARKLGINNLKRLVPFSKEKIIEALKEGDQHLNKWGNGPWDNKDFSVRHLAYSLRLSWSLSDTVCVLKHVAKFYL